MLQGPSPFAAFRALAQWLWQHTGKTSGLTPEKLLDALFEYGTQQLGFAAEAIRQTLLADYLASGARSNPACLEGLLGNRDKPQMTTGRALSERQARHST